MRGRPRKEPIEEMRHDMMADFENKVRNMHAACRWYDPKPIHEYTNAEATAFAGRQANDAAQSIGMSREEKLQYAYALLSSINYFNARSAEHKEHMRYLRECATQQRMAEEQHRKDLQKQKQMLIIIK